MRYLVSILLLSFIVGCATPNESMKDNGDHKKKSITIKIIDNKSTNQHYLLSINSNGKIEENVAELPQSSMMITDDNKEAKVNLKLNTKYIIKVSKTKAKNVKEFLNNKKSGQTDQEVYLKDIEFTPSTGDKELEIKI
jgi:hypothetical protein